MRLPVLYTLKPLFSPFVLELLKDRVDGFAGSSLFEDRGSRSRCSATRGRSISPAPGLRPAEIDEFGALRLRRLQLTLAVSAALPGVGGFAASGVARNQSSAPPGR